ncbi:MAG: 5-formyltetrahydrofolate cyclo-ligase [Acidimicrobiia bacterium]|nr:MAG: 5-formyltetrahydrofolate cyclo-ligase [Acidimicrobiia bacterium]
MDKADLRRMARRLPPPTEEESGLVRAHLAEWLRSLGPALVVAFHPLPDEVDLRPLLGAVDGIRWALTRTEPTGLTVHPAEAPLERHRFGFMQPVKDAPRLSPDQVDVVLVPGLLFDRRGGRLGRGAGFFDRFLQTVRAIKVGVAVERRLVDRLPTGPEDVPMDLIVTEAGIYRIPPG